MRWLVENWHVLLAKPWDEILLVLVATVCGAWVGTERQRKEKAAGLRTMALVALGSCTFTMVSYAFSSNTGDAGRVAAQIVTGIGFLGAGVLLRGASGVQGMTRLRPSGWSQRSAWPSAPVARGLELAWPCSRGVCLPWPGAGNTVFSAAGANRWSPLSLTVTMERPRSS